jgi:dTMP kinase
VAFFERVRGCYLERAEREPLRCVVIDASQSITAVQAQLDRALTAFLQRSGQ